MDVICAGHVCMIPACTEEGRPEGRDGVCVLRCGRGMVYTMYTLPLSPLSVTLCHPLSPSLFTSIDGVERIQYARYKRGTCQCISLNACHPRLHFLHHLLLPPNVRHHRSAYHCVGVTLHLLIHVRPRWHRTGGASLPLGRNRQQPSVPSCIRGFIRAFTHACGIQSIPSIFLPIDTSTHPWRDGGNESRNARREGQKPRDTWQQQTRRRVTPVQDIHTKITSSG